MRSLASNRSVADAVPVDATLRLIWKSPKTGRYFDIGRFESLADGTYSFTYVPDVNRIPDFLPLIQFPDVGRVYVSPSLPAFFANRIMSRRRPDFEQYLAYLGLTTNALPAEILARTGGTRMTDTFHLVEDFDTSSGACEGRFFVSGIRHRRDVDLASLNVGDELTIVPEPDNEVNDQALLLTKDGRALGWVPNWMLDDCASLRAHGRLRVFVDQVNTDAPLRLAVLCRFTWRAMS